MRILSNSSFFLLLLWNENAFRSTVTGFTVGNSRQLSYINSIKLANNKAENKAATSALMLSEDTVEEKSKLDLVFTSPILLQLYPKLLHWKETYGHPNIPLGSEDGRLCRVLRKSHIQKKLTKIEVDFLESIGFVFHSMEDVYKYGDFDEIFGRLLSYEKAHPESNFQVPKKCPQDPELGAWVTGIRRLGKDVIHPDHVWKLDSVGFAWKSNRKCGSKFMEQYRDVEKLVKEQGRKQALEDPKTMKWLKSKQGLYKRGKLSETRIEYMEKAFGDGWSDI